MYQLIISGDSHTQYLWPTWADFLTFGFDDRINLGKMGVGNDYIFNITYPYIKKHPDSKFIISWAEPTKFDVKKQGNWIKHINMTWHEHVKDIDYYNYFYDKEYWKQKTENYINCFADLNESVVFATAVDLSYLNIDQSNILINDWQNIGNNSNKKHYWKIGRFGEKNQKDFHLICSEQLEYAKKISKNLQLPLYTNFDDIAKEIDKNIYTAKNLKEFANNPITLTKYINL